MSDELLFNNYLMLLKSITEVYIHATIESSNECTRKILKYGLDETLKHQEKTYNIMVDYDWYTTNNINPNIICDSIKNIK